MPLKIKVKCNLDLYLMRNLEYSDTRTSLKDHNYNTKLSGQATIPYSVCFFKH